MNEEQVKLTNILELSICTANKLQVVAASRWCTVRDVKKTICLRFEHNFGSLYFSMNINFSFNISYSFYLQVKVALAITVLLGLTWFFGTIAIGSSRLAFQYLFCIFNSLQGFAIFWFHCVRQPEVRQCWADFLRGRRGRQRRYTASTTAPAIATNAVKKSSSATASPKLSPFNSRGKYKIEQQKKSLDRNHNTADRLWRNLWKDFRFVVWQFVRFI